MGSLSYSTALGAKRAANPWSAMRLVWGDRAFKLGSGTTSEPGRYVKYPGGAP
jgi:hypothetical protein